MIKIKQLWQLKLLSFINANDYLLTINKQYLNDYNETIMTERRAQIENQTYLNIGLQ